MGLTPAGRGLPFSVATLAPLAQAGTRTAMLKVADAAAVTVIFVVEVEEAGKPASYATVTFCSAHSTSEGMNWFTKMVEWSGLAK